jgi:translation initiation factor IF-2
MTDKKTPDGDKTLHASGAPKTLSVKRPETGVVRQAFSHGRSKAVVVEIKRPTVVRPAGKAEQSKTSSPGAAETAKADVAAPPRRQHRLQSPRSQRRSSPSRAGWCCVRSPRKKRKLACVR